MSNITASFDNVHTCIIILQLYYKGYHGDCSETYLIGDVDDGGCLLVDVARQCRDAGIAVCKPGARFSDIGQTIRYGYCTLVYFH